MGERTSYPPGTFSWVDLQTTDQDAAKSFYADLLGWEYDEIPIGDGSTYAMAKLQGHSVAMQVSPAFTGLFSTGSIVLARCLHHE